MLFITTSQLAYSNDANISKEKIVFRIYQTTEAALATCPEDKIDRFKNTLTQFKRSYPHLIQLVTTSQYYHVAVEKHLIHRQQFNGKSTSKQLNRCMFMREILIFMMHTEEGEEAVGEMIEILSDE